MTIYRLVPALLLAALTGGCASTGSSPLRTASATALDATPRSSPESNADVAATAQPAQADRDAILAMAGEYHVRFDFQETVALAPGYERKENQRSGAYETVIVLEDSPELIVLQHLLVSKEGGHVTKHWRQDWHWQAPSRFEFTEDQTWRERAIAPEKTLGAWTQCVYEVSDAPRYCGTGKWNHKYGVATWTSDRGWRPLPRREHTKRDDYNALNVENRHTIVPAGWTHEQDNTKTQRLVDGTSRTLVREFGFNDYERLGEGEFDFSPAYRYWEGTRDYWARVRNEWDARFAGNHGIVLDTPIDGMPIIMETFQQADRVLQGETVTDTELRATFDKFVKAPGRALAAQP